MSGKACVSRVGRTILEHLFHEGLKARLYTMAVCPCTHSSLLKTCFEGLHSLFYDILK